MRAENLNLGHQYDLDNFARIIKEANQRFTAQKLTELGILVNIPQPNINEAEVFASLRFRNQNSRKSQKSTKSAKNMFKAKLRKSLGL